MKDKKIVELFKKFFKCGHIHDRSKENMFHWEVGSKKAVLELLKVFSKNYPVKLSKMKDRMGNLQRILNDYTPRPRQK